MYRKKFKAETQKYPKQTEIQTSCSGGNTFPSGNNHNPYIMCVFPRLHTVCVSLQGGKCRVC